MKYILNHLKKYWYVFMGIILYATCKYLTTNIEMRIFTFLFLILLLIGLWLSIYLIFIWGSENSDDYKNS